MATPEFKWERILPTGPQVIAGATLTTYQPTLTDAGYPIRGAVRYPPGEWVYTQQTAPVARQAFTGTAASTVPKAAQAATGTRTTVPGRTGTAASTVPKATQAATGTRVNPGPSGTAASTVPAVTQAATGTHAVETILASDTFGRTETTLTTSSSGHTWTHPHAPTRSHGADGTRALHTGSTGETASGINVGQADVKVRAKITPDPGTGNVDAAVCGRLVDNNTYLLAGISIRTGVNRLALYLHDATYTQLGGDYNLPGGFVRGATYTVELAMVGTAVTVRLDNVVVITATLTTAQMTALSGGVSHGLRSNNEANGSRWDDLQIVAA